MDQLEKKKKSQEVNGIKKKTPNKQSNKREIQMENDVIK